MCPLAARLNAALIRRHQLPDVALPRCHAPLGVMQVSLLVATPGMVVETLRRVDVLKYPFLKSMKAPMGPLVTASPLCS